MDYVTYVSSTDIEKLIKRLVQVPSISNTAGEVEMANEICKILLELPYFQENPENVMKVPIEGDPLGRENVVALFRGKGSPSSKTVVLLSHFDVVGVEDFGNLKEHAFAPEAYTKLLKNEKIFDPEVVEDLSSGEWLFARGIMDMKAGLAGQIAVLSALMDEENFSGNLLLIASPDEERNSEGMFAVIPFLNTLKETHQLEYELCICSEPSFASEPGCEEKYIYTGSVGKLLPLIMCVGKETHVGEPLEGLNAGWMVADLVTKMELSNKLVDKKDEEISPLPTCLKVTDLKEQYNVQTPSVAYALYNVLTLQRTPNEIVETIKEIALESAASIHKKVVEKYQTYNLAFDETKERAFRPAVFTFAELYERGQKDYGSPFVQSLERIIANQQEKDFREQTVDIAVELMNYFAHEAPFYLIMLAPPYYPHVYLNYTTKQEERISKMVAFIIEESETQFQEKIKVKPFFNGLSDVSYCRMLNDQESLSAIYENMPLLGNGYNIPIAAIREFNVPTINIGPFGKDAHKSTERLEVKFSTEVFPKLLKRAIKFYLGQVGGEGNR